MNFMKVTSGGTTVALFDEGEIYLNTKDKTVADDIICEVQLVQLLVVRNLKTLILQVSK